MDLAKEELGISRPTFYRLQKQLSDSDMIYKQEDGFWYRMAAVTVK
jgi:DNA-binding IclR family transcriptional regulator